MPFDTDMADMALDTDNDVDQGPNWSEIDADQYYIVEDPTGPNAWGYNSGGYRQGEREPRDLHKPIRMFFGEGEGCYVTQYAFELIPARFRKWVSRKSRTRVCNGQETNVVGVGMYRFRMWSVKHQDYLQFNMKALIVEDLCPGMEKSSRVSVWIAVGSIDTAFCWSLYPEESENSYYVLATKGDRDKELFDLGAESLSKEDEVNKRIKVVPPVEIQRWLRKVHEMYLQELENIKQVRVDVQKLLEEDTRRMLEEDDTSVTSVGPSQRQLPGSQPMSRSTSSHGPGGSSKPRRSPPPRTQEILDRLQQLEDDQKKIFYSPGKQKDEVKEEDESGKGKERASDNPLPLERKPKPAWLSDLPNPPSSGSTPSPPSGGTIRGTPSTRGGRGGSGRGSSSGGGTSHSSTGGQYGKPPKSR